MGYAGPVDSTRWYAVQTKPKQVARAEANLRGWGVETLAPHVCESERSTRCEGSRVTPLFFNYMFARFDAEAQLAKVRLTRGVQRVVGFGEYATPVDDAIIALIRSRIGSDGLVRLNGLVPGDAVEIVDGPLRSIGGVFERHLRGTDRVLILLTTIGSPARVQVASLSVRKTMRSVA